MASYSSPTSTVTSAGHSAGQCCGAATRSVAPTETGNRSEFRSVVVTGGAVVAFVVVVVVVVAAEDAASLAEEGTEEAAKDLAVLAAVAVRARSRRAAVAVEATGGAPARC
jgi:hypothetical protein